MPTTVITSGLSLTSTTTLPTLEQLPDDITVLKSMLLELMAALQEERRDKETLRHRLHLVLERLYGRRNERFNPNQLLLFDEVGAALDQEPTATPPALPTPPVAPRRCRPHGRRQLPEMLPREVRHHQLAQAERLCVRCGQLRLDIGSDRSEQLEYRPAALWVVEHVRHKYVCPCCRQLPAVVTSAALPTPPAASVSPGEVMAPNAHSSTPPTVPTDPATVSVAADAALLDSVVITAPMPPQPIDKGLPGPGLLAHLIVSKYQDHLPLHRLERIYERQGVFLPRSTLCDWLAATAKLLQPLYQVMIAETLQSRVLHTDDTPVEMQEPATRKLRTARLWAYIGAAAHPYNVFDFTTSRKRDGPQQFLKTYQGYLQADAFSGYDCLYLPAPGDGLARIIEVACHAHARRKFYEARTSDALRSVQALGYYRMLYALERGAVTLEEAGRHQMRQEIALPILQQFHAWLLAERPKVLPKSPMGEAIGYALNNWTALLRYTEAGCLAIDNNVAEREMKRVAIGRKNWLFVGSEQGGHTAALMFSFTSSCQRLGVEPWAYLHDVLRRLPTTSPEQLPALLPDRWHAARPAAAAPPAPSR